MPATLYRRRGRHPNRQRKVRPLIVHQLEARLAGEQQPDNEQLLVDERPSNNDQQPANEQQPVDEQRPDNEHQQAHDRSPGEDLPADEQQPSKEAAADGAAANGTPKQTQPPGDTAAQEEEPGRQQPVRVSRSLDANTAYLRRELGAGQSFDVLLRELTLAGRAGLLAAIDGFVKDDLLLRLVQFVNAQGSDFFTDDGQVDQHFLRAGIGYLETEAVSTLDKVVDAILAGQTAILVDGLDFAVLVDVRTYPARTTEEPELERVIRGPRDGFTETLVHNTALVRRRLRDPRLRIELLTVGKRSKSDVALLYIQDIAQPQLVEKIRHRLKSIQTDGIPMAERTVEEFIVGRRRAWNLFPTVRYTERPDVTAIHLLEGHIAIITDTSPAVMLLPITFFHHLQHAQEFHEEPVTGLYLRWLRYFGIFLSWLGPPLWLAAALASETLPEWLRFIGPRGGPGPIPLYLQLILAETGIDLIRLALIHTPNALASALGIIGAILLGELAVEVGLFVPETILYVAMATIGSFATPSAELGNAIRLQRLFLVLLAGLGGFPALGVGLLVLLLVLLKTRSFGVPYLWPLVPFNRRALADVLLRQPATAAQVRPSFLHPQDPDRT